MVDTTEIAATGQAHEAIHCLTIPLHEETVLLPNAAIAEIVAYIEPASIEGGPDWFLGNVSWRETQVPLISFEAISGKDVANAKKNSRIAILNTLNGNTKVPYVGILSQGIPSIALVQEEGIEEPSEQESRIAVGATINVGGVEVLIPNIDELEQQLQGLKM